MRVCLSGSVAFIYWNESDGNRIIIRTSDNTSRAVDVDLADPVKRHAVSCAAFNTLSSAAHAAALRGSDDPRSVSDALNVIHVETPESKGHGKHLFFDLRKLTGYSFSRQHNSSPKPPSDQLDIRITVEHGGDNRDAVFVFVQLGTKVGSDVDKQMKEMERRMEDCWERIRGRGGRSVDASKKP